MAEQISRAQDANKSINEFYSSTVLGEYTREIIRSLNCMKKRTLKTKGQQLSCNKKGAMNGYWNKQGKNDSLISFIK